MNWKIIILLSLLGLVMGVGTISLIPMNIEPFFWIVIFLFSAYVIARACASKYFLHGFFLGLCNCVWITGAHVIFYTTYMKTHPQMATMPLLIAGHPRISMIITGFIIGAVSGLVIGLFSFIASKLFVKKVVSA